jgi:hypothetical protein
MKTSHEKAFAKVKANKANVAEHSGEGNKFKPASKKNVKEHNIRMSKFHKPKEAN